MSILIAAAVWWFADLPQFIALPVCLVAAWLLLRFHVPSGGERMTRVSATPAGRAQICIWSVVVAAHLLLAVLWWAGLSRGVAWAAAAVLVASAFPPLLYQLHRAERHRKQQEVSDPQRAVQQWESGEATGSASTAQ